MRLPGKLYHFSRRENHSRTKGSIPSQTKDTQTQVATNIPSSLDVNVRDGPQHVSRSLSSHRPTLSTTSSFIEPEMSCSIDAVVSRLRIQEAAESAPEDGDKETMGGYVSSMQMDDMPIDWVEQVISFLSLTDVYKCKSVCKAWHVAADRVLSDWETLALAYEWDETCGGAPRKNRIFLNDDETWIERLQQLVRLKKVSVTVNLYWTELLPVVKDVVLSNAATLTLLHMRSELPFDVNRPVVFSNLRDLECRFIRHPDQVAALSRLEKLWTHKITVKVLQKLPAETLTGLRIDKFYFDDDEPEPESSEEMEQLFAAFSRLTRLKRLILVDGFRYFPDEWTEPCDRAFGKMFTNMRELDEVDITFPEHFVVNVDAAIEKLVDNCLSVRSITMYDAVMTDASLRSLSRLTGLQLLSIRSSGQPDHDGGNPVAAEGRITEHPAGCGTGFVSVSVA